MTYYFIYAKDYSSSTYRAEFYHINGLKTLDDFENEVKQIKEELLAAGESPTESKVIYLHWNSECVEVDGDSVRQAYENRIGEFGTYPEVIIRFLKNKYTFNENDKIKLIYIITDGQIGGRCAQECFESNEDMHYEKVVFHAFNENLSEIDFSVAASFLKGSCMVFRNYELYDNTDISKEFDYDKINKDNFQAEKDGLNSYIKLKFIRNYKQNTIALREIDKLKKLRSRLFAELSANNKDNKLKLDTKDKSVFLEEFVKTDWYKKLTETDKIDIEKSISTMINYIVSDAKSYSFDALKFVMKFNKPIENEEVVDVNFTPEEEIEFPDVILTDDKGIPVVILTKFSLMDKIIFHNIHSSQEVTPGSFNKFKSAMECPLLLVNDKDISESIGYFYTLNVYKQLLANKMKTEPRTRKPFHGGLILTNTDQFDKYNDYILSITYFNGKKVKYNVGLFYYVLWKNCENKEWMDRNVVEQFKKYTMRRISETVCKIGLSSLPLDPQENTSLLTALWYCVELSSCIFKDDPENFKHERLRMYHGVAHHMIEILKHFDYDLDLTSINKRKELIVHVMVLKRIPKRKDKVYYLLENIFKTENGFLVSVIEKPFNLYKLNYLNFDHKEMLRDDIVNEVVHLNDYVHLLHIECNEDVSKANVDTFEISEKTLRPFFFIDDNKSFYTELVKNNRKVVIKNDGDKDKIEVAYEPIDTLEFDRVLSLCKMYIDCVKDSKKYPTLPEYVEYVSKKKKFNEEAVTIFPPNVYIYIKDVYDRYQKLVEKIAVPEFNKTSRTSVNRIERIKSEDRTKFSDDNGIREFISNEEEKVHLKKKT